ncbi:helix-turn-helix transcriptional regulator, partial [Kitasatospora sp. NPDC058263]
AAIPALTRAYEAYAHAGAGSEADRVRAELDRAMTGPGRHPARPRPIQGWDALTASERKVARLIAAGHTNRSAAAALVVSPHTVNTHLTSIFRKLSVNSRVHLTRLVLAQADAEPVGPAPSADSAPAGKARGAARQSVASPPP